MLDAAAYADAELGHDGDIELHLRRRRRRLRRAMSRYESLSYARAYNAAATPPAMTGQIIYFESDFSRATLIAHLLYDYASELAQIRFEMPIALLFAATPTPMDFAR